MNIQLFANFDEFKDIYNAGISDAKNEMNNLEIEKQNLLNEYNTNYNNQISQYDDLTKKQQDYIDTWASTQKETQQKQTDYNVNLINQNKAEAQKQTDAELGNAYIDYQKSMNQYGGNAEKIAANGLAGTGFAKNTDIAMNVTYQNRVSTAKAALLKANTDYDNQIQQALLNNDAALAEIALQQMQQSYQLALQGFEYKTNLYNNKLSYEQSINNEYFNRNQTLQNRIDTYNNALASIEQTQQELAEKKAQREQEYQQWLKEFEESKRQFNASLNSSYSDFNFTDTSTNGSNTSYEVNTPYYQGNLNTDANKYGTFSNGYQPKGISGYGAVQDSGYKMVLNTRTLSGESKKVTQTVWKTPDGSLWYWDGRYNRYIAYSNNSTNKTVGTGGGGGGRF